MDDYVESILLRICIYQKVSGPVYSVHSFRSVARATLHSENKSNSCIIQLEPILSKCSYVQSSMLIREANDQSTGVPHPASK